LPIWLKYCVASSCFSMIVADQSTEALPPYHWTCWATNCSLPCDQLMVEPLIIAFRILMCRILLQYIMPRSFT
jgi:hypothetical protein